MTRTPNLAEKKGSCANISQDKYELKKASKGYFQKKCIKKSSKILKAYFCICYSFNLPLAVKKS